MEDKMSQPSIEISENDGRPPQPSETGVATTDFACNECRRRKCLCTRELPECSVCKRNGRHCLYERHSRTPLTRKHLTEVEELLRIATQILRQRLPEIDLQAELELARNGSSEYDVNLEPRNVADGSNHAGGLKRKRLMSKDQSLERNSIDIQHPDLLTSALYATNVESLDSPGENNHGSNVTNVSTEMSMDHLSPEDADYDWDEREGEMSLRLDGMATLSVQDEKPGYLGVASGAALLNMIQTYTSDPFATMQPIHYTTDKSQPQSKFTPSSVDSGRQVPSHKIAQYISDYFTTYHINYPLVHQGLFMAQYNELVPRPRVGWLVLMYTVAAIGAFMGATTANDDDLVLFNLARSHLSVEMLEIGNLTLVQSLTLISNYLQKRDRPNSGYNYLGLAVRMAFGLGLHKEFPNWKGNLLQTEMRRRVWWCLYIFDAGSTITYSRPLGIPSTGIDARLPLNTFDSDMTAGTTTYPANAPVPTIYTNVRVQSQFHLLTNSLYNRIISKPCPSAKEVLDWDDHYIGKWLHLVPDYYKDDAKVPENHSLAHAIMIWRYKNLRMILYRPFLIQKVLMSAQINVQGTQNPSSSYKETSHTEDSKSSSGTFMDMACDRCRNESHDTIKHIDQHWRTNRHTRMASWYALFFLFPAVLVPLISLRNEPQSPFAAGWHEDINTATQTIRGMVELVPSAARFLHVLEKLSAGFFTTSGSNEGQFPSFDESFSGQQPIDESPVTQMLAVRSLMFPDDPLCDQGGQLLYYPGEFSGLGMTSDDFAWPNDWPNTSS